MRATCTTRSLLAQALSTAQLHHTLGVRRNAPLRNTPASLLSISLTIHTREVTEERKDLIKITISAGSILSKMPTAASTTSASAITASLFRRPSAPFAAATRLSWPLASAAAAAARRNLSCQVALTTDVSSSLPDGVAEEEAEAATKIGARIRVKVSVKVYHVMKAPELDLYGMEGVIKQYVGVWKGKRITANLPFRVEFLVSVAGQEKPIKFVAHLREYEFEYLPSSD